MQPFDLIKAQGETNLARLAALRNSNLSQYLTSLPASAVLASGIECDCSFDSPLFMGRLSLPLPLTNERIERAANDNTEHNRDKELDSDKLVDVEKFVVHGEGLVDALDACVIPVVLYRPRSAPRTPCQLHLASRCCCSSSWISRGSAAQSRRQTR